MPSPAVETQSQAASAQPENNLIRRLAVLVSIVVIAIFVAFCYFASSLCITLLLATLLAILVDPIVKRLERCHCPRSIASALVLIVGISALGLLTYASYGKATTFLSELPQYGERIRHAIAPLNQKLEQVRESTASLAPGGNQKRIAEVRIKDPPNWPDFIVRGFGSIWGIIIIGGVVPFLTFFMLIRKQHMQTRLTSVLGQRIDIPSFIDRITEMVRGYVTGNLIVGSFMAAVSVAVFIGLGMKGAIALGIASGILNLIPFLGVLLAELLPLMAALLQYDTAAPYIIILLTVCLLHLISANILIPKFIGSRVKLGPVAATVGILFWGWLWGALGLLLAIPLTAMVKIIADCHPSMIHVSNLLAESPRPIPNWAHYGSKTIDRAIPFLRQRFSQRAQG
jgi:predicted PurR-regulated permease PerM